MGCGGSEEEGNTQVDIEGKKETGSQKGTSPSEFEPSKFQTKNFKRTVKKDDEVHKKWTKKFPTEIEQLRNAYIIHYGEWAPEGIKATDYTKMKGPKAGAKWPTAKAKAQFFGYIKNKDKKVNGYGLLWSTEARKEGKLKVEDNWLFEGFVHEGLPCGQGRLFSKTNNKEGKPEWTVQEGTWDNMEVNGEGRIWMKESDSRFEGLINAGKPAFGSAKMGKDKAHKGFFNDKLELTHVATNEDGEIRKYKDGKAEDLEKGEDEEEIPLTEEDFNKIRDENLKPIQDAVDKKVKAANEKFNATPAKK